jgi:hypothetical protein
LAILVALRAGLGLETWQAIAAGGLGWLLLQVWRWTLGRPLTALGGWVEQRAAGVPLRYTQADLPRLRRRPKWLVGVEQWRQRRLRQERNRFRSDEDTPSARDAT